MNTGSKSVTSSVSAARTVPTASGQSDGRESLAISHQPAGFDSPTPKPVSGPPAERRHTFPQTGGIHCHIYKSFTSSIPVHQVKHDESNILHLGHKLGHGSADDARVNNPRNLGVSFTHQKTKPSASPLSGGITVVKSTSTDTKQQQWKNDGPLPEKSQLLAGCEPLTSTVSSEQQLNVERPDHDRSGQQFAGSHLCTMMPTSAASLGSLWSSSSSGQQLSVHSSSDRSRWEKKESCSHANSNLSTSHDSLNSTVTESSGQSRSHRLPLSINQEKQDGSTRVELNDLDRTSPIVQMQPLPQGLISVPLTTTSVTSGTIIVDDVKYQPLVKKYDGEQHSDEPDFDGTSTEVQLPSKMDWQGTYAHLECIVTPHTCARDNIISFVSCH